MSFDDWVTHVSGEDASVNFSVPTGDGGMIECRFVCRDPSYFIIYISSHTGCRHACRFCHLTQTGQTMMNNVTAEQIVAQARRVFAYYDTTAQKAQRVNINFMARGEPLSNPYVTSDFSAIAVPIMAEAAERGLDVSFNMSTIMPQDGSQIDLAKAFEGFPVRFYWSLYSLDDKFRKRWLPKAQDPGIAIGRLQAWQEATQGKLVLHWALIAGENDDEATLRDLARFVTQHDVSARFNLVRYNSFSDRTGVETDDAGIARAMDIIGAAMRVDGSRVVPRVGQDVKASCGMFLR